MSNNHEILMDDKENESQPVIAVQNIIANAPTIERKRHLEHDRHFTVKLSGAKTFRARYFTRSLRPVIHPRAIS